MAEFTESQTMFTQVTCMSTNEWASSFEIDCEEATWDAFELPIPPLFLAWALSRDRIWVFKDLTCEVICNILMLYNYLCGI